MEIKRLNELLYRRKNNYDIVMLLNTNTNTIYNIIKEWLMINEYIIIFNIDKSIIKGTKMIDVFSYGIEIQFKQIDNDVELTILFTPNSEKQLSNRDKLIRIINYIYKKINREIEKTLVKQLYTEEYYLFKKKGIYFVLFIITLIVLIIFILVFIRN
jgi:hypothetical protein